MEQESSKMRVEYGLDITHVQLADERILDEEQIRDLSESLEAVIERNKDSQILMDFVNVKSMTSAMLGLLVRVHKRVCERGGQLKLCNLDPSIQKVFEITQLTKVFDIS